MPGWSQNPFWLDDTEELEKAGLNSGPPKKVVLPKNKRKAAGSSASTPKPPTKKKNKTAAPILFTSDSEEDFIPPTQCSQDEVGESSGTGEQQLQPLQAALLKSFFSQRGSSAYTTQRDPSRSGEYYIELRVYNSQEVEREPNDERWKRALVTLKTCTDSDTAIWRSVSTLVKAAKEDFKKIQPIMYPINL